MRDRFTPRQRLCAAVTLEGSDAVHDAELQLDGVLLRTPSVLPEGRVRGTLTLGPLEWPFEAEVSWRQSGSSWLGTAPVVSLRFTRIDPGFFGLLRNGSLKAA